MLRWALWRTTRRRLRNSKERSALSTWSSSSRPSSSSIKALICSTSIILARQASLDILASLHVPFFFTKFSTAELLVPLLRLVPDLRLCPWGLPSDHRHVQHRRREPAQQQQPRLQNPSRTHRCPLLRCLLGHHLRDLLHGEAGGLYPVLGSTSWHCVKRKIVSFPPNAILESFSSAASEAVWQGENSHWWLGQIAARPQVESFWSQTFVSFARASKLIYKNRSESLLSLAVCYMYVICIEPSARLTRIEIKHRVLYLCPEFHNVTGMAGIPA